MTEGSNAGNRVTRRERIDAKGLERKKQTDVRERNEREKKKKKKTERKKIVDWKLRRSSEIPSIARGLTNRCTPCPGQEWETATF